MSTTEKNNKIETKVINSDILADILNVSATIKRGNTNRTAYNYVKCAENISTINKIMQLNLSESECEDIKKNKNIFAAEKTKIAYAQNEQYAKVKKQIRKFVQNFKAKDCPFNDTQKNYITGLLM